LPPGTLYYLHQDHLGSTSVVTCGSGSCGTAGAVIARQWYHPYGSVRASTGGLPTDITFTGQRADASTGLYFYNARYYSGALGRFIQADTIVPGAGSPQALNRYAYVLGNPLKYTDPSGHTHLCAQACEEQLDGVRPPAIIWTRLPVETPRQIYYYGNTLYAFEHGKDHSYDTFAQGMHPGIDLSANGGTPVYAGTYGKVSRACTDCKYDPGRVEVSRHGQTLLYGHLANIQVEDGDLVTPDTIIGYIDNGAAHVHIEIIGRTYDKAGKESGKYMTNPLPHFAEPLQVQIARVAEEQTDRRGVTFYVPPGKSRAETPWQTPYDQPVLLRQPGWIFPK